jgi:hypothetical protein
MEIDFTLESESLGPVSIEWIDKRISGPHFYPQALDEHSPFRIFCTSTI